MRVFLGLMFGILWTNAHLFAQKSSFTVHKTNAALSFDVPERTVFGNVKITFDASNPKDSFYVDAVQMQIENLRMNNKKIAFRYNGKQLALASKFKKKNNVLTFTYKAKPKQSIYFVPTDDAFQIWTQGQGKYTSHWLPSFDDMNVKQRFEIQIDFDAAYEVISNGFVKDTKIISPNRRRWIYQMDKPMSSYLVMLAIGKYKKNTIKTPNGTIVEGYIEPIDVHKFEPTYRYTPEIFAFLEREIGVPYPWGIYRQVPVRDFLYAGMENTTSTIFSRDFVVDSIGFNDRTYVNVNAHELAHQWFGNLVTSQSGLHHWLQEGFATYYALLSERHLFGDDHYYWELYEMAERIQQASKSDHEPIMSERASSLSYYQKGAWALVYLREKIGDSCFKNAVKSYLTSYAYANARIDDFLDIVRSQCDFDTEQYKRLWLTNPKFPINEVLGILKQNQNVVDYLGLIRNQQRPFSERKNLIEKYLTSDGARFLVQEAVYQLSDVPIDESAVLLKKALQHSDLFVRQSALRILKDLPEMLREEVIQCLQDESYLNRELSLALLWYNFPQQRAEYLDIAKSWVGFNDKNLRILWLSLALMTDNYCTDDKTRFYDELLGYTTSQFETSVRQNALSQALFLNPNDINVYPNLVNAATSYKWQFSLFARNKIKELLKSATHRSHFTKLMTELSGEEIKVLKRMLEIENQ